MDNKQMLCAKCAHCQVCFLREEFTRAQTAIDNLIVPLGDMRSIKLRDMAFIESISIQCKHYFPDVTNKR